MMGEVSQLQAQTVEFQLAQEPRSYQLDAPTLTIFEEAGAVEAGAVNPIADYDSAMFDRGQLAETDPESVKAVYDLGADIQDTLIRVNGLEVGATVEATAAIEAIRSEQADLRQEYHRLVERFNHLKEMEAQIGAQLESDADKTAPLKAQLESLRGEARDLSGRRRAAETALARFQEALGVANNLVEEKKGKLESVDLEAENYLRTMGDLRDERRRIELEIQDFAREKINRNILKYDYGMVVFHPDELAADERRKARLPEIDAEERQVSHDRDLVLQDRGVVVHALRGLLDDKERLQEELELFIEDSIAPLDDRLAELKRSHEFLHNRLASGDFDFSEVAESQTPSVYSEAFEGSDFSVVIYDDDLSSLGKFGGAR